MNEMTLRPEDSVLLLLPLPLIHCSLYLPAPGEGLLGMGQHFRRCGGRRSLEEASDIRRGSKRVAGNNGPGGAGSQGFPPPLQDLM